MLWGHSRLRKGGGWEMATEPASFTVQGAARDVGKGRGAASATGTVRNSSKSIISPQGKGNLQEKGS